ncbi:MAG: nucleoside recognition domain-containing protein [Evtepia sp.]
MKRFPLTVSLLLFALLLLSFPAQSTAAAKYGITLCLDVMIPSLFPFFVLSSLFVSLGLASSFGKLLKPIMRPLFALDGVCASPLVLGAIGGYPVGLRTLSELYLSRQCSKNDAIRLSLFCNNCGPAFLLSVTGLGVFSSRSVGFFLLFTHLSAAVCVGFLSRFFLPSSSQTQTIPPHQTNPSFLSVFPDCVRDSFFSTLNVSAFVILFTVLVSLADKSGALSYLITLLSPILAPEFTRPLFIGIFELSTAICSLNAHSPLPLAAFLLAWGGLSVHCQTIPFLRTAKLPLRPYFCGKLLQAIIAASLTALLMPLCPPTLSVPTYTPTFFAFPPLSLLKHELLALWCIAGVFSLIFSKKRGGKTERSAL